MEYTSHPAPGTISRHYIYRLASYGYSYYHPNYGYDGHGYDAPYLQDHRMPVAGQRAGRRPLLPLHQAPLLALAVSTTITPFLIIAQSAGFLQRLLHHKIFTQTGDQGFTCTTDYSRL